MVEALAEFSYEAEQDDELTITAGDIIKNVVTSEGGWWEGELNGRKGLFPDNFVKILKSEEEQGKDKKDSSNKETAKVPHNQRASVRELANKLKDGVHVGSAPVKKRQDSEKKKHAKALFAYEPENDDEMKIEIGDIIEVTKQEEEGWWEGSLNGKTGMFPSNFVEIVDDMEKTDKIAEEKEGEGDEFQEIKGRKVMGIGLGNIFQGGPIKLRATGTKKTQENKKEEAPPTVVRREKPVRERAVVRYSYAAENEDELELQEGQIIEIVTKDLEDPGWWKGEVNGKSGVFPDNFVEILPPEEVIETKKTDDTSRVPKPRKPPPPSTGPGQRHPPKLPEKAPVAEPDKQDKPSDHHTEKHVKKKEPADSTHHSTATEKHLPVVPGKKPAMPPPVGRKPHKPAETPLHATSDPKKTSHAAKDEKLKDPIQNEKEDKEKPTAAPFDALEPTTEKLRHLTADRAKGPTKRPPSQEEERNGDVREPSYLKDDRFGHRTVSPPHKEIKEELPPRDSDRRLHGDHGREKPHGAPARPPEPNPGASYHAAIEELKRELREIKASSVSVAAYEELRKENEQLKKEIDSVKSSNSRRFREIMQEIDEEKKLRLTTQVEIERIRKLVAESHV